MSWSRREFYISARLWKLIRKTAFSRDETASRFIRRAIVAELNRLGATVEGAEQEISGADADATP